MLNWGKLVGGRGGKNIFSQLQVWGEEAYCKQVYILRTDIDSHIRLWMLITDMSVLNKNKNILFFSI